MTAEIDLKPFCNTLEGVRWNGTIAPWTAGEFTFATDGRIAVRVAARALPENPGRVPTQEKIPWDADGEWKPLPNVASLETFGECEECEAGLKPPTVKCPCCGTQVPYPGEKIHCPDCVAGRQWARLDGQSYGCAYLNKIHALPGPIEYLIQSGGPLQCNRPLLHFRFAGGRGLLMPAEVNQPTG